MHLIRRATNLTIASNYAVEGVPGKPSIMAMDDEAGPVLVADDEPTEKGSGLILTKTHCHGYCSLCARGYIHNPRSFELGCRTRIRNVEMENGTIVSETGEYDAAIVKKAIHLFRHPLDNIVSRFHHEAKEAKAQGDAQFELAFPNDKNGFQQWCSAMDQDRYLFHAWPFSVDGHLKDLLREVPCYSEFFKYVQWVRTWVLCNRSMSLTSYLSL